jgi:hypothetical protein
MHLALLLLGTVQAAAAPVLPPEPATDALLDIERLVSGRCAGSREQEIVVCGRRDEDRRYRLPPQERFDPKGPVASVSRERNRLLEGERGGLGSCSVVGPNGMTGCLEFGVQRKRQQTGR